MRSHKFETFEDWFNQLENYHLLSERYYEEFDHSDITRNIQWLKAAFLAGREQNE